jgi:TatD DNase family protein
MKTIDAHIHLELYPQAERQLILDELAVFAVEHLVAVSMNLSSCEETLKLHRQFPNQVLPAFGFHPEQVIPPDSVIDNLFKWIIQHQSEMIAVGEVGLPYYNRYTAEQKGELFDLQIHIGLLDRFIALTAALKKPIILHAVYEDADIACDLLEKHKVEQAHFHWFKGSRATINRMIMNGYYISFTPDIIYEAEIQQLAELYPITQIMMETDGPWPFEGPFAGKATHPRMITKAIRKLAEIKALTYEETAEIIRQNTLRFYNIEGYLVRNKD